MLPVLYSFRRCPYAMRARMAVKAANIEVELREVVLADKPAELLACSPKATVPVMVLPDGKVLEESLDIMHWALSIADPHHWLPTNESLITQTEQLISANDGEFKPHLDRYKYAERFPEQPMEYHRAQGEDFLQALESLLQKHAYLVADAPTLADIAIFPFVRQFAHVDRDWFYQTAYTRLQYWLDTMLASRLFEAIMKKYKAWESGAAVVVF